jgi:hypothetical protein
MTWMIWVEEPALDPEGVVLVLVVRWEDIV